MKITVSKKELSDALRMATKGIAVKTLNPILSGVKLSAVESRLELQSTDNTIGIKAKIPASVEEDGATVIAGKKLLEIVLKLSGEVVTISTNENDAEISSEEAKFNLLTFNAEEFPEIKTDETLQTLTLRKSQFKNFIRKTAFATSKEDSRPIFTGVCFKISEGNLNVVATDTHRLAVMTEKIPDTIGDLEFIVPAKILQDIANLIDDEGEIKILNAGNCVSFDVDNFFVTARIIAGVFPPFEKVIPKESTTFAIVPVADLKNVVERINVIAKETDYTTCRMIFEITAENFENDGLLKLSATSPEVGKVEENLPIEIIGGNVDISFNINYWLDVLKILDCDKCLISLTESLAPIEIQELDKNFVGKDNFIYIATPVRKNR